MLEKQSNHSKNIFLSTMEFIAIVQGVVKSSKDRKASRAFDRLIDVANESYEMEKVGQKKKT